jgi:hypothetical protein
MANPVLVIARDGDVWVFRSTERAANWMEAQDVRDGEYRLFECDGREYQLSAESDLGPVIVSGPSVTSTGLDLVRVGAARFIATVAPSTSDRNVSGGNARLCEVLWAYAQ